MEKTPKKPTSKVVVTVNDLLLSEQSVAGVSYPFLVAFEQLVSSELSPADAWPTVEAYDRVQHAVKSFNEARNKLIKELGTESVEGSGSWAVSPANIEEFARRLDALLSGKVELPLNRKIKLPPSASKITPKSLYLLYKAGVIEKPANA